MNTKKILLLISVSLILILGAIFLLTRSNNDPKPKDISPSPTPPKIRVAYISLNKMYSVPLSIAENTGLFNKYNISVDVQSVDKSPAKLLIANQVDTILNTPLASLTANIEGANISWTGTIFSDSPIVLVSSKKPQEIKTISYPAGGGSLGKSRTTQLLEELKLDSSKVTLKEVSSEEIALTTLMDNKVDAIANITKSSWLIFKKKNNLADSKFQILINSSEKENLQISGGIMVNNNFLKNNQALVENFSKSLIEATFWARSNKEKTIDLLATKYSIDKEEAEIFYDEYLSVTNNVTFAPNLNQADTLLKVVKITNPKAENYPINSFIFNDISNSLKNNGFLEKFGFK